MSISSILLLFFLPMLMAYACFSDLFSMTISNRLCSILVGLFAVFAVTSGMSSAMVLDHVLTAAIVLVVSFAMFAFGWVGGGDAKFVTAVSLWVGFGQLPEYLLLSSVLGGLLTVGLLWIRGQMLPVRLLNLPWVSKLYDKKTGIPYGIALGISGMAVLPSTNIWQVLL